MPKKQVKKFKFENLESRKSKNYEYKVIRAIPNNKKRFGISDIEEFYKNLKKEGVRGSDVSIEVMGIKSAFTLKYYKNEQFYDFEDYLRDKVEDPKKFTDSLEYFDVIIKRLI